MRLAALIVLCVMLGTACSAPTDDAAPPSETRRDTLGGASPEVIPPSSAEPPPDTAAPQDDIERVDPEASPTAQDQAAPAGPAQFDALDLRDPIPGVVQITITEGSRVLGQGSGPVLEEGIVVTAQHLFALTEPGETFVTLPGGNQMLATRLGQDGPFTDVAVLAVPTGSLTPIALGDSDDLSPGDQVVVSGWAGRVWSASAGPVIDTAATFLGSDVLFLSPTILVAARSSLGQSGGAVVDQAGNIVAMIVGGLLLEGEDTGSSAVPINEVLTVARGIVGCGCDFPRPDFGAANVTTIWEGNAGRLITPSRPFRPVLEGAILNAIIVGSPFDEAGLVAGDIVLAIDDVEIRPRRWYHNVLKEFEPGESVLVTYRSAGETRTVNVTPVLRQR